MNKNPVTSASLAAVGFDSATQTLEVEFQNERVYRYYGVPWVVFADLQEADSKGRFFNSRIRNRYPYVRVGRRAYFLPKNKRSV
ncbi:MAG: KTSC domain-containing protein [Candidatus Promineofilum sp.]|jgi:hypothetical protein|nr:KTSC domain-containing protein [Promineifilum sp.]